MLLLQFYGPGTLATEPYTQFFRTAHQRWADQGKIIVARAANVEGFARPVAETSDRTAADEGLGVTMTGCRQAIPCRPAELLELLRSVEPQRHAATFQHRDAALGLLC